MFRAFIAGMISLIVICPARFAYIVKATSLSLPPNFESWNVSVGLKLVNCGKSVFKVFSRAGIFAKSY